jgi:hypothetical protein
MTILCITGFSNASTQLAERALLACGMASHLPLERDPTIDLVRWHERVSSALPPSAQSTHSQSADRIKQPSRIWQQLAIDLMVANMDSANWGWAHPGAVQWLEFWAQLESDIRFVLVCEDRQSLICRLVEQGEALANMPGHLALWAQNHQEMLRFHLRNPDRSLLVWDAEVQSQPSTLIQRIEGEWQIPLDPALAHAQTLGHPTALLQHIALRILSGHPQTAPIDHELQSIIGPSHWPAASDQIETTDLIEIYGRLQECTNLQGQLQRAQKNIDDINELRTQDLGKAKAEIAAKQDALNKLAAEQKSSAALKKQTDELSSAQQQALAKNQDLQEESDLLLTQLHQVQEELEKYYLQHKERQIEVQKLQDRWLRAVQSHPELQDFEVLELVSESKADLTAQWRINQLQVGNVMKGPFEFKTFIENGVTGLVFTKEAKGLSPIHRWPLIAAKEPQLSIIPVKGKEDPKKRSATLLQLGTTDWHLVRQLTDKLVKTVGSAAMAKQISHGPALLEGLKTQQQILDKVPALLRFDDIQLFGQQNTQQKSVIGLRLTQADLQGLKANPFEFQIQLNFAAGSAMASAHLIFDEKTVGNPFENWKHNVKSSAGHAVMAMQLSSKGWDPLIWHALSPLDQQWLQNTVRLLPFMLSTLQNQGVKLEKGWTTWVQAAIEMVNWSKLSVDLPKAPITDMDVAPSMLQPPDAAPAPPRAPRKPKPVKVKPAKPVVSATVTTKVPQKPMGAKSMLAKPAVKVKAATKVATKAKRRTA